MYLHCSRVFTGPNARVRKTKKVRKLLEKNQHSFGALTNKYDLGTICNVAKELLDAGIFESNPKAETQFPDLFRSSHWEESEPSDFDATRSEADAMEEIVPSEEKNIRPSHVTNPKISSCGKDSLPLKGWMVMLSWARSAICTVNRFPRNELASCDANQPVPSSSIFAL